MKNIKIPLELYLISGSKNVIPLMINDVGDKIIKMEKRTKLTIETSFEAINKFIVQCTVTCAIFVAVPGHNEYFGDEFSRTDPVEFVRNAKLSRTVMRGVFNDKIRYEGLFRQRSGRYCLFFLPYHPNTIKILKQSCPNLLENHLARENFLLAIALPYPRT